LFFFSSILPTDTILKIIYTCINVFGSKITLSS
jgi:hypothetical protein